MDRLGYIAMTGAKQTMLAQAVVSNNLANASTPGFRSELVGAAPAPVYGDVYASRVNSITAGYGADFASGTLQTTGRDLDIAVNGRGWFAVQAADGSEAYSRAGDLRLDAAGILTNGAGHAIVGDGGPIAIPPFQTLSIGRDGTISIVAQGQDPNTVSVVDRIKLVNPPVQDLERGTDGLFRLRDGAQADSDASVALVSGALEGSNVNAAASLVEMIELSRSYEMQIKMIATAREDADNAAQMMRMR